MKNDKEIMRAVIDLIKWKAEKEFEKRDPEGEKNISPFEKKLEEAGFLQMDGHKALKTVVDILGLKEFLSRLGIDLAQVNETRTFEKAYVPFYLAGMRRGGGGNKG